MFICSINHVYQLIYFLKLSQWLMRIFFASTIGFQVPIKHFGSGKIIGQGLFFTLALIGKLVVGFMVPNFSQEKNFKGAHLRDCLIVGCSMVSIRLMHLVLIYPEIWAVMPFVFRFRELKTGC